MDNPRNSFKQALREGRQQIGLWVGLADAYAAELLATAGFDWLLIDGEHAPNDLRSMLAQLQAVAAYPSHPVVRPPIGDTALIKQILDTGAQTLLIPMVESARQAEQVVAATRYPPNGVRGVGSALARSSRWNRIPGYLQRAEDELCVLVQIESLTAIAALDEIMRVPGIDGIFFGPSDLAASMGYLGQPAHAEVQRVLQDGIAKVLAAGKAPGILITDPLLAQHYLDLGALFVAVGVDTTLLVNAASGLAARFKKDTAKSSDTPPTSGY